MYFRLCLNYRELALTVALATTACGDSYSGGSSESDSSDSEDGSLQSSTGGSQGPSGTESAGDPSDGPGSSGPTDGASSETGLTSTSGETTSGGGGEDLDTCPCGVSLECGDGDCDAVCDEETGQQEAWCVCNTMPAPSVIESELSSEYYCVQCAASDGDLSRILETQIISTRIDPSELLVTLDDANDADLYLMNTKSGDRVPLGRLSTTSYQTRVLAGLYELIYGVKNNTEGLLPDNTFAPIERVGVAAESAYPEPEELEFSAELPVREIEGSVMLAGGNTPMTEADYGLLLLRNKSTGDEITLTDTLTPSFSARVLYGDYELVYEAKTVGDEMPANPRATLRSLSFNDEDSTNVYELGVTSLSGNFKFNSEDPTADESDHGEVFLRLVYSADEQPQGEPEPVESDGPLISLGSTKELLYAIKVVPGTYDVIYSALNPGEKAPVNKMAVIERVTLGAGAQEHTIDIPTARVSGSFRFGDSLAPADVGDDGAILLEGETKADDFTNPGVALLGHTHDQAFTEVVVIPGSYQKVYAQETASAQAPINTRARYGALVVSGDGPVDVDVPVVTVSGGFTLNGGEVELDGFEDARVYLKNVESGDAALLGNLSQKSFAEKVIVAGSYDVFYSLETGGSSLPANLNAKVAGQEQTIEEGGGPILIDIPSVPLTGAITFGGPSGNGDTSFGLLYLIDAETGDEVYVGRTDASISGVSVIPGSYELRYRYGYSTHASESIAPQNRDALIDCLEIQ